MLRCALAAVPMACAVLLSSCYGDEADGCPPDAGSAVPVKVNVSAGEIGDLNASRAGGDANAEDGEFINTLHVYIVSHEGDNALRTFMNLSPDLTGSALAQKGNLTEWTSEPLTLIPGTYTFYAFANIEEYEGEYGAEGTAVGIQETTGGQLLDDNFVIGQVFSDEDINSFRLFNPAGKIDLDGGKFIPMSAKGELTITSDLNASGGIIVDLPLERLVSKVRMTVGDGATLSSNASVTFSGCSRNVPLMAASTDISRGRREASATKSFEDGSRQIEFYVNETPTGEPFTVTLSTGKSGNGDVSAYVAKTQRTDIPRNSIYPLSLTFPDFTPQFEWQSWEAAIGSVPVEVVVEENNYIVKIASGNTFKFTVNGVNGTNSQLQSATWAHGDVTNQITDIQIGNNAISGAISAGVPVGTLIPLTVTVNWRADYTDATSSTERRNFTRTYNVTIETIDIWDTKYKPSTRSGSWRAYRLTPEVLNMFIKR